MAYPVDLRLSRLFYDAVGEHDASNRMSLQLRDIQLSPGATGLERKYSPAMSGESTSVVSGTGEN